MTLKRITQTVCFLIFMTTHVKAELVDVIISDPSVFARVNGADATQIDIEFRFTLDTSSRLIGGGPDDGDLFESLDYFVTSSALGIVDAMASNQLFFELQPVLTGQFEDRSRDGFLLYNANASNAGQSGVFGYDGQLRDWDGMSDLPTIVGGNLSSGGFGGFDTQLTDGTTIDGLVFNFNDTSFTASVSAIPEPVSSVMLTACLLGLALRRRRNEHRA